MIYIERIKEDDIEKECPGMTDSSKDMEQKRQRMKEIHQFESKQCDGECWNL